MLNRGGYQPTEKINKPITSINFGNSIEYKTANQEHFTK
jgi:hypothetical protein